MSISTEGNIEEEDEDDDEEDEDEEVRKEKDDKNFREAASRMLDQVQQLKIKRINLFNYSSAYDAYVDFIIEAKKRFAIEDLRRKFPSRVLDASYEQILTPNFVCFLAMKRLRRILMIDPLPPIDQIIIPDLDSLSNPESTEYIDPEHFNDQDRVMRKIGQYIDKELAQEESTEPQNSNAKEGDAARNNIDMTKNNVDENCNVQ